MKKFDVWAPRLIPALVFAVPLFFILDLNNTFDLAKITLVYSAVLILAGMWVWQTWQRGKLEFRRTPLEFPILAFLVVSAVSAALSLEPELSLFGDPRVFVFGVLPLLAFALLYWFTLQAASAELVERVVWAALCSGAVVGLYALLQFSGNEIFDRMPLIQGGRPWASLGNPLYMGAVCMMALPLALSALAIRAPKILGRLLGGALLTFCAVGVWLSLSRSAWVGAFGSLAILGFLLQGDTRRRWLQWGGGLLAAAIVGLMIFPSARERAEVLMSIHETSNASRLEGWKAGLEVFGEHPLLGSGPDTFSLAFRQHRSMAYIRATGPDVTQMDAHNDFIQVASTVGGLGLTTFLWVLVVWGVLLISELKQKRQDPSAWASIGLVAALVALVLQDQFNFSSTATCAWAAVFTGLAAAEGAGERKTIAKTLKPSVWLGGLLAAVMAFGAWEILQPIRADLYYTEALAAGGHMQESLAAHREAVRLGGRVEIYQTGLANRARDMARSLPEGPARQALLQEAWNTAGAMTRRHPYNPDAWNNYGVAAMWLTQLSGADHMKEAEASFRRALTLDPLFVDAWANLAKWEHLSGHPDQEKILWQKVLVIDPGHVMARQVLGIP